MEKSGEHAGSDVGALQRGARQGDAGDRGGGQGGQGAQAQTQGQKVRNWMTEDVDEAATTYSSIP